MPTVTRIVREKKSDKTVRRRIIMNFFPDWKMGKRIQTDTETIDRRKTTGRKSTRETRKNHEFLDT